MARSRGTNTQGRSFTEATIDAVWRKAQEVLYVDPSVERRDRCGARILRSHYGDTSKRTGWEIDHIKPVSAGGGDDLPNLQPLQWENNRSKGDMWPAIVYCVVTN